MTAEPADRIGARIRARRTDRSMSQADLARRAGISASYLNLIEHGKRRIGGRVLSDIAHALGADVQRLREGAPAPLMRALSRAAAAHDAGAETREAERLATEFPGWAALVSAQAERIALLEARMAEMGDRMAHDPELSASVHDILSTTTAIRSTAAILREGGLEPEWLARFHRNLDEDSRRLAGSAQALAGYLTAGDEAARDAVSPQEEVEAWLNARAFRVTGAEEAEGTGLSAAGREALEAHLGAVRRETEALPEAQLLAALAHTGDPFELSRALGQPPVRVLRALARLPEEATGPLGLVVCDGAGAILLRRPLPGFELPRYGAPCALWPLFQALLTPQAPRRDVLRQFGTDARPVEAFSAAAIDHPEGYGGPMVAQAAMLLRPAPAGEEAEPGVGVSCRLCPREGCAARREPSIL